MPDSAFLAEYPGLPAIITARGALSFQELEGYVAGAARQFRERGVSRGDVAGLALGQTVEAVVALQGLIRLGAVACMVDYRWPRAEIERAIRAAGCREVVTELALTKGEGPAVEAGLDPGRRATVVFTSGSTGESKPAVHSLDNHLHSAAAANANMPVAAGDVWLLSLPLHHVGGIGILFRCAAAGAAVAVGEAGMSLNEALDALRPTHVSLVPTQLGRLLADEAAARSLAGMKGVLLGGAPMPPALVRRAFELGVPLCTSYGLTETSSQVTATKPGEGLEALMTSGSPLRPGTVSITGEGEILVRGETLFQGYMDGGELARPLTPDGWFSTGDMGKLNGEGRLLVEGRRDNMFVSGGENVQPEEVERRLAELPGVEQAIVVPVPDVDYGQVGIALVKATPGVPLDLDLLRARLREQLPAHKIPKQFRVWPSQFPESAAKLSRKKLASLIGLS